MRSYYDPHDHRLTVEIKSTEPAGEGAPLPQQQGVTEYRDRDGRPVKYMIENIQNNDPRIRDLAYSWMTAIPGMGIEKNDLEALKLLKEWCTWLVAIETGVIGAIGVMHKDIALSGIEYKIVWYLALLVIVALGVSICASVHMVLAIPGMAQRLPPTDGDIYSLRNSAWPHRQLVTYVRLTRWSSLAGLGGFALLLFLVLLFEVTSDPA
jgi:hypothetical protein